MEKKLKLVVPDNFIEFGKKVNDYLNFIRGTKENYIVDMNLVRFSNGEGKCVFNESINDSDVYILTDVYNYDITYNAPRGIHYMMPDEHYQDLKRIISAIDGMASKINIVMPFLYQSRQDKKREGESFDCGMFLKEIEQYGVNELITFDAHNPGVANILSNGLVFNNAYAIGDMASSILKQENINADKLFIVSPDNGALPRAKFLADILGGIEYGKFDKKRDHTKVEGGKNPIIYQEFVGPDNLNGLDIIIIDDMIASGSSLINAAKELKQRGARYIYLMTTFALFTEGIEKFKDAHDKGFFDKLYTTNLSYIPQEYKNLCWFYSVDCSYKIANIINNLHDEKSIELLLESR